MCRYGLQSATIIKLINVWLGTVRLFRQFQMLVERPAAGERQGGEESQFIPSGTCQLKAPEMRHVEKFRSKGLRQFYINAI